MNQSEVEILCGTSDVDRQNARWRAPIGRETSSGADVLQHPFELLIIKGLCEKGGRPQDCCGILVDDEDES
jgi:hypothetical protein